MTREEFALLVKGMKAVYADPKFIADKFAFDVWYSLLADYDYKILNAAVQKYMMTAHFPPTPADIRECAADITRPTAEDMTPEEAWEVALKAIRNSLYGAEEEFERLPAVVQKSVVSPSHLREMGQMNSDELHTVEKSHFMRAFRTVAERRKNDERLSPQLREIMASIKAEAIGKTEEHKALESA